MSDDLVKRLRAIQISTGVRANFLVLGERPIDMANKSVQEAADRIESLTAEVAWLTAERDAAVAEGKASDALATRLIADIRHVIDERNRTFALMMASAEAAGRSWSRV